MIKIPGHLAIRTIQGRNGAFNVGRLSTSIGEFVIKDAVLEQHVEGKYRGEFVITEIRASSYSTGGRLVIEIRARLDSMMLEDLDALTAYDNAQIDAQSPDPLDEEQPVAAPPSKARPQPARPARPANAPAAPADDNAPFGMPVSPAAAPVTPAPDVDEADQELFGTVWPLGETVRLDSTVDRQRLRQQCQRLSELGYAMDFKSQAWNRAA
ncbi:hypothetical protein BGI51_22135 [Pseudomonas oryzihabitans]|uniref:DUF3275 family protein n=1 Tax=Pseudomonas oryzihabitans TaxID=47885 RepID=UPI00165D4BBB|nr:DUF3275 family protein [Pseudomonas psychrotolerans]QNR00121.1 hypothetical protein BGI51_22135 [Pseudomonas psychrotolerans]